MTRIDRRLIEEWLPILELGIESGRERTPLTPYPAPNRLHTWWARRPLVMSRAAVLASILPADADREKFVHALGIHGDPLEARRRMEQARREKERLGANPYGYNRAFTHVPNNNECSWVQECTGCNLEAISVVDPTAGGGSIPLESHRLGCATTANDLNPVAVLLLHATINWPSRFGIKLIKELQDICDRFIAIAKTKLARVFPDTPRNISILDYLWARAIPCPYCSGLVPLSPNWRIASDGTGVALKPDMSDGPGSDGRVCSFQIVRSVREQSEGTVSKGDGLCPYPDCRRVISGAEIKTAAKAGDMGEQLYAVVYKERTTTRTKTGRSREKWVKGYRGPKPEDYDAELVQDKMDEKIQEWHLRDIIPMEQIPPGSKTKDITQFGINYWRDLFSPRQLLCHGTSVEVFRELLDEDKQNGALTDMRKAAYAYLAIALDTLVNYNSRLTTWHANRMVVGPTFARHDYGFSWSYVEMVPTSTKLGGYEWVFDKTRDSLRGLIELTGSAQTPKIDQYSAATKQEPVITCKSADDLDHIEDGTVDVVVMDPPYYDNVMYSELSDFFYVWLKRTAGLVFPELFQRHLTDKENEAVANPAKFAGQKGAKAWPAKTMKSEWH